MIEANGILKTQTEIQYVLPWFMTPCGSINTPRYKFNFKNLKKSMSMESVLFSLSSGTTVKCMRVFHGSRPMLWNLRTDC